MDKDVTLEYFRKLGYIVANNDPDKNYYKRYSKPRQVAWKFYHYLANFSFVWHYIALIIPLVTNDDFTMDEYIVTFMGLGFQTQILLKFVLFADKYDNIEECFRRIEAVSLKLSNNPMQDGGYANTYHGYYDMFKRYILVKNAMEQSVYIFAYFYYLKYWFVGNTYDFYFSIEFYWPFDPKRPAIFPLTVFWFGALYASMTARHTAMDITFLVCIITPAMQLEYLGKLMESMLDDNAASRSVGEDGGIVDYGSDTEALLYTHSTEETQKLKSHFSWWAAQHVEIISITKCFGSLSSPYLFIAYATVMFNMFWGGIIYFSVSNNWDWVMKLVIGVCVMACWFQLFVNSMCADFLQTKAMEVVDEGFTEKLLSGDKSLRTTFLNVSTLTSRPLLITCMGLYPLSCDTFYQLCQMTFSFFVTILQLQNAAKEDQLTVVKA